MLMMAALVGLGLVACQDSGKQQLQQRVESLERENAALKAERDALKAQAQAVAATTAVAAQKAQDNAVNDAASAYARRCATSLAMIQVDSPTMALPPELDGKACDDTALGENSVSKSYGIADSSIHVLEGGEKFTIDVTDSNGDTIRYSSP